MGVAHSAGSAQRQIPPKHPLRSAAPRRRPPSTRDPLFCLTRNAHHRPEVDERLEGRQGGKSLPRMERWTREPVTPHPSWHGQPVEHAAVGLVNWNDDMIGRRRAREGRPVRANTRPRTVGLGSQAPTGNGPKKVQQVAGYAGPSGAQRRACKRSRRSRWPRYWLPARTARRWRPGRNRARLGRWAECPSQTAAV